MKTNRMVRMLCALMVMLLAMSGTNYALAVDEALAAKAASPASVTLDVTEETLLPGQMLQLTATVEPADASQSVTWKSSKTSVATVSSKGKVTAKGSGTAKITATTKKGGKKASCTITVSKSFAGTNVHFYGIGNSNYISASKLPGCKQDVDDMAAVYASATFASKPVYPVVRYDQTGAQMVSMLESMATNPSITENDITVLYYSGHGLKDADPAYHGALIGIDARSYGSDSAYVTVGIVQRILDRVPGHVVVILDSCYSGQFIKTKGSGQSLRAAAAASNNAWISALSGSKATNFNAKSMPEDSPYKNKYRLLTASSNAQESTMLTEKMGASYGLFTWKLTSKLQNMSADSNNDRIVSLKELYNSVNKSVASFRTAWNRAYPKNKIEQVTKVWPSENNFPVFARN